MINAAIVGYGYWGPNLVRNFNNHDEVNIKYVCELKQDRLQKVKRQTNAETTTDYDVIISDPTVDIVAIATPVNTHYTLAKKALLAKKHVFIEKPMTNKVEDSEELVKIARDNQLILMVDHTFVYTGAVRKMKQLIQSGTLGDIYYFDSVRVNLGLFQSDINVLGDLAPHDLSIILYIIDKKPISVSAIGVAHVEQQLENIAYLTLYYPDNTLAHFHVNWLSPVKIRKMLICGSSKMIVYDDMENLEKIKIYDKGLDLGMDNKDNLYRTLIEYRTGDMYAPKLDGTEALNYEIQHFVSSVQNKKQPITDGTFGLEVVKILQAAQISMERKGEVIQL